MDLKVINDRGEAGAPLSASDALFGRDYNEPLVHQLVVAFQANARLGTRKQKTRSEIAKSTRKPWRQKGTGRARAGMASSPLWRGGGRIFPNTPDENFSQKVNRKMYRAGLSVILSQLVREARLTVIDDLVIEAPKTKLLVEKLATLGLQSVLIVTEGFDENLYLSARNVPGVGVLAVHQADPVALVHFDHVLLTRAAVTKFEEMWV